MRWAPSWCQRNSRPFSAGPPPSVERPGFPTEPPLLSRQKSKCVVRGHHAGFCESLPWNYLKPAAAASCPRKRPAVIANLSARVGSISDNSLGGWYSYRYILQAISVLLHSLESYRLSCCVGRLLSMPLYLTSEGRFKEAGTTLMNRGCDFAGQVKVRRTSCQSAWRWSLRGGSRPLQ